MASTIWDRVGVGITVAVGLRVAVGAGVGVGIVRVGVGKGVLVVVDVPVGIASTVAATPASMVLGKSGVAVGVAVGNTANTIA